MDTADPNPPIVSTVRAVHRVPLGELAARTAETRAKSPEGEFNSSI